MKLIIGNITFHHFTDEELKKFKDNTKERKALVHDIQAIVECLDYNEAVELGEDSLGDCAESYLIIEEFEKNGEVAYECSENCYLPITPQDFKTQYLTDFNN